MDELWIGFWGMAAAHIGTINNYNELFKGHFRKDAPGNSF